MRCHVTWFLNMMALKHLSVQRIFLSKYKSVKNISVLEDSFNLRFRQPYFSTPQKNNIGEITDCQLNEY